MPASQFESAVTSGRPQQLPASAAPVCYLASPIDRAGSMPNLRKDVLKLLDSGGFAVFDPSRAWSVPNRADHSRPLPLAIGAVDFAAVDNSDCLLAMLPDEVPTIGVAMEIERALQQGKPTVVVGGLAAKRSPLLVGRCPIYDMSDRSQAVFALQDAVKKKGHVRPDKPTLKVSGPGQTPTRGYSDDCGVDLFTFCDRELIKTQDDINRLGSEPSRELLYHNPDGFCVPANFDRWRYKIRPGEFVDIDCGVEIQCPAGSWGLITGRSSAIRKKRLLVISGVIDTGFRGRLFVPVLNVGQHTIVVENGERLGQFIPLTNVGAAVDILRVETLDPSERGTNGFGSTGT